MMNFTTCYQVGVCGCSGRGVFAPFLVAYATAEIMMRAPLILLFIAGTLTGCGGRTRLQPWDELDGTGGVRSGAGGDVFGVGGQASGGNPPFGVGGGSAGGAGGFGVGGSGAGGFGVGGAGAGGFGAGGTGGADPGCAVDADCDSPNACMVASCEEGACSLSPRDEDADGYPDRLCGGSDCNDSNPLAHPGRAEVCGDGSDNDCNGVADCFDPVCKGQATCACVAQPGGENCSNGSDDDCDGSVDCNDADCLGSVECGCTSEICGNGLDDDCDSQLDCDDSDCGQSAACQCSAKPEACQNGGDDDCDGLIDCADPSCGYSPACLCLIPQAEQCGDKRDNDCDGLVDCGDPSCFNDPSCRNCQTEICSGGADEDCDGLLDCADPSCAFDAACPVQAELCNNSRDDDFDGATDCDDSDCSSTTHCQLKQNTCATARRIEALASASYEGTTAGQPSNFDGSCGGDAGEAAFRLELSEPAFLSIDTIGTSFDSVLYVRSGSCGYGREIGCDDDSGGSFWSSALEFRLLQPGSYYIFVDGLTVDPRGGANEGPYVLNVDVSPVDEICDDAFDNDGNGYADCADPSCASSGICATCNGGRAAVAEFGASACTDGLDNDCDGLTDCADDDCSASDENVTECCTGSDQNGNGIPDDFNCRCVSDAECDGGQICYTSTVKACGIPCDNFFGEICPFVAPGSSCNLATGQCEF